MKIQMLTSMAGTNFSLAYGELTEVSDAIALAWIGAGIAAPVVADTAPEPHPAAVEEAIAPAARKETATIRRRKAK